MRAKAVVWSCRAGWASALVLVGVAGGCNILGFGGAMVENYKRSSTHSVEPEYTGLNGKTFAVVIATDRITETDYPGVVVRLAQGITERVSKGLSGVSEGKAGGTAGAKAIAPETVLTFQYNNPRWRAMTYE